MRVKDHFKCIVPAVHYKREMVQLQYKRVRRVLLLRAYNPIGGEWNKKVRYELMGKINKRFSR